MKPWLKVLTPYVRIGASILLLWLAFRGVDWQTLRKANIEISPVWFILAILVMLFASVLAALRWAWLARAANIRLAWGDFIGLYFAGALINQGLPTMIGGDSYRAIEANRMSGTGQQQPQSLSESLHQQIDIEHAPAKLRVGFFVIALDRGLGFVGNNIVGAMGLMIAGLVITPWATLLGGLVLAAMVLGVMTCALLLAWSSARKVISSLLYKLKMSGGLPAFDVALGWPQFLAQLIVATIIHLCTISAVGLCLRAYGATAPLEALMVALPALGLLMLLPISISGWGLRESTLAAVLALWSVDPTVTLLSSVSFGLATLIASLPGAFILLRRKNIGPSKH